jgi:hypothetical protein
MPSIPSGDGTRSGTLLTTGKTGNVWGSGRTRPTCVPAQRTVSAE